MELQSLQKNKKYLLALSGGVDSMVMADLFLKQGYNFEVAHCNFSLRAKESDLDEALVKNWSKQHNINCFIKRFDTKAYAMERGLSIQESARDLRYQFFNEVIAKHAIDFVATAHHQDDNIETLFFHFLRGTGLKGLCGIPQENQQIVRPLLRFSKEQIIIYANRNFISFRNDSSNSKDDYMRNKIRNQLIPLIEESFPSLKANLAHNLTRFNEANQIYENALYGIKKKLIEKRGNDFYIPIRKLKNCSPIYTITYEIIKQFQFSFEQAVELIKLIESQTGSLIQNKQFRIIKNRDFFIVTAQNSQEAHFTLIEEKDKFVLNEDFELQLKHISNENLAFTEAQSIAFINNDLLEFPLILRKWRHGDYLYPLGMKKKKKVARVLIDAKLSLPEKEQIWVLESNKKIVWILGLRLDDRFKVHANTRSVLQIKCIKNNV